MFSTTRAVRFARLSGMERAVFLRALGWVAAIRLGLGLVSFKVMRGWLRRVRGRSDRSRWDVDQIAWGVRAASRYVPRATCLTQALAGQALLAQSGFESRLHVGVSKEENGEFHAHAWLECNERIIIGESERNHYVPLTAFSANRS